MKTSTILALCLAPCAAFAQAHHAATPQRPPETTVAGADAAAVKQGHAEFKSSCGFCHGEDATGGRAPDLVRSTLVSHDENGNLLAPMIRNGRPDKGMPSFATLKDDQLAGIIAFLHAQVYAAAHNADVPGDYPVRKLLTGNADEGKKFFYGPGGCNGCHSVDGDLKGVAKRFSAVDLQQNMIYPEGKNLPPVTATVKTTSGETVSGTLKHRDEFRISLIGPDGWYRSFDASKCEITIHDPLQKHRELMSVYTDADMHNLFAFLETLK